MGVEITHQSLVKYRFGGLAPVYIYTYHHHKHTHFTMPETIRRKQTPSRLTISKPMTNPTFSKKGEPAKLQVTWRSPNSSPGDHSNVQMKKKKKKMKCHLREERGHAEKKGKAPSCSPPGTKQLPDPPPFPCDRRQLVPSRVLDAPTGSKLPQKRPLSLAGLRLGGSFPLLSLATGGHLSITGIFKSSQGFGSHLTSPVRSTV